MKGIYMKNLNKEFGKLLQDGTLEYAPEAYNHNGADYLHPTADDYKAVGYLLIVFTSPPTAPEGKCWVADGYEVVGEEIHNKWKLVDDILPPRVFSKMKVVAELSKMNVWNQVKAWIEQNGLYDLYLAAQNFSEDNQNFKDGIGALKSELHLSDQDVEGILSNCILED